MVTARDLANIYFLSADLLLLLSVLSIRVLFKPLLDSGADGLVVQMVESYEEVEKIVDPIKPPRILQNIHGYFELASERTKKTGLRSKGTGLCTRLDFCL